MSIRADDADELNNLDTRRRRFIVRTADYAVSQKKWEYQRDHGPVMLSRSEASRSPTRETLRCGSG
jgi:hypothetical protein